MGCCASEQGGLETERREGNNAKVTKSGGAMGKKSTNLPKLIYFPVHGKGDSIRMLLNHANVEFEDKHVNRAEVKAMRERGELPLGGQVPVWRDENGVQYNQTAAIMIMLGKKYGYYPEDPWDSYEDDWALANFQDIWGPSFSYKHLKAELDEEEIAATVAVFEKWNNVVERKLTDLGARKFIGGKKPSVGDFITFSAYGNYVLNESTKVPALRNALKEKVENTPRVKTWMQSMQEENKAYLAKRVKASL